MALGKIDKDDLKQVHDMGVEYLSAEDAPLDAIMKDGNLKDWFWNVFGPIFAVHGVRREDVS